MRGLSKFNVSLETLRAVNHAAYRVASLFVNLESVEQGALNSRLIEYPFVLRKLYGTAPGRVLDVGCTDMGNVLAPILATLGWTVHGIDIRGWRFSHPNFHLVIGDASRCIPFADGSFDWVYAVSSIEHFGLPGRYGVKEGDVEADFNAMSEIQRVLKPEGHLLLTIPYGAGGSANPLGRTYDRERLSRLLTRWAVQEQCYWRLDGAGVWHQVPDEEAGRTAAPGLAIALLDVVNGEGYG